MTGWREIELGEVVTLINGDRGRNYPSAKHRTSAGIPFINAGMLVDGWVRPAGDNFISPGRFEMLRSGRVEPGDVILCIRGSIGRVALATPDVVPSAIASSLVILRPERDINPRFLYALLESPIGQRRILASDNGAAQPNLGARDVAAFRFTVPDRPTQDRIAEVLGAIDDLIENNRRQVEVLEEMARAIYREWFVHFRYPGHESVPLVDSPLGPIPGDWTVAPIGDLAEIRYGQTLPKTAIVPGPVPVYGAAKVIGFHALRNVTQPTIVMGCRGTCGRVTITESAAFVTNNSFTIVPKTSPAQSWLFHTLDERGVQEFIGGSAQPQITLDGIAGLELVAPAADVTDLFWAATKPMSELARTFRSEATSLISIRERLLPKLVTGQIDVSSLDLDSLVEGSVG